MTTAKIFTNGRSQAVRLPKEYRFKEKEVTINKIGEVVFLIPKSNRWKSIYKAIEMFSDDFMEDGRSDELPQKRNHL